MIIVESMYNKETCDKVEYTYSYRLTKTNMVIGIENQKSYVQAYGIEAERKDMVDGIIVNIERESIKAISPQRHKVHNLIRLLCDNCVSPIHCIDVLGSYVDEYTTEFESQFESELGDVAMN